MNFTQTINLRYIILKIQKKVEKYISYLLKSSQKKMVII